MMMMSYYGIRMICCKLRGNKDTVWIACSPRSTITSRLRKSTSTCPTPFCLACALMHHHSTARSPNGNSPDACLISFLSFLSFFSSFFPSFFSFSSFLRFFLLLLSRAGGPLLSLSLSLSPLRLSLSASPSPLSSLLLYSSVFPCSLRFSSPLLFFFFLSLSPASSLSDLSLSLSVLGYCFAHSLGRWGVCSVSASCVSCHCVSCHCVSCPCVSANCVSCPLLVMPLRSCPLRVLHCCHAIRVMPIGVLPLRCHAICVIAIGYHPIACAGHCVSCHCLSCIAVMPLRSCHCGSCTCVSMPLPFTCHLRCHPFACHAIACLPCVVLVCHAGLPLRVCIAFMAIAFPVADLRGQFQWGAGVGGEHAI